ncbi:hypothetical protein P3X46_026912 [Hevea brasiliensis]|uniref:Transmembrane protein n=1 Tax=Hevea brasiliensis TaxID=3981 RepID=A0ABQ9KZN9_HEVBR|nr:hypothetical protein P3X46_033981 [Hevea brasiliensis]KAJ9153479.1 hypothetical protein P3X46_026912 [Hevea brasiliensis]
MAISSRIALIFVATLVFHFLSLGARKLSVTEKDLNVFPGESEDLSMTTDILFQSVASTGISHVPALQSVPDSGSGHYPAWQPVTSPLIQKSRNLQSVPSHGIGK